MQNDKVLRLTPLTADLKLSLVAQGTGHGQRWRLSWPEMKSI